MARRKIRIDLFVEDQNHEIFCNSLIARLAASSLNPDFRPKNVLGGHGKALTELRAFQRSLENKIVPAGSPDLLVILIDANCQGHQDAKRAIKDIVKAELFPHHVIGCPDPHVEKWYLAEGGALNKVFGHAPSLPPYKCERGYYKNAGDDLIRQAEFHAPQGIREFGPEIVQAMDIYNAEKLDPSLGAFIEDLRTELNRIMKE